MRRGIWDEICRAGLVTVGVSVLDATACLGFGMAHVLARPTVRMAQGGSVGAFMARLPGGAARRCHGDVRRDPAAGKTLKTALKATLREAA